MVSISIGLIPIFSSMSDFVAQAIKNIKNNTMDMKVGLKQFVKNWIV